MMCEYHKKYPRYGFLRHKGYATKEHVRRIMKHGPSPIHRASFNPVKKLLPLARLRRTRDNFSDKKLEVT